MVTTANLIPTNVLRYLRKISGKKALLFTGSRVVGKATLNSDWDFFVILDDKFSEWRNTSLIDKHLVEVFCINQKDLLEDFNDDLKDAPT